MADTERVEQRLQRCLAGLDAAEQVLRDSARRQGIDPDQALSRDGAPVLAPILAAQAQLLAAMVTLRLHW